MTGERPPYIAVCGGGAFDERSAQVAREVGEALALQGAVVLCGGLGGVMEAVCEGARSQGGLTIGFLPGDDRNDANEFVDIALPTGLGEMRNMLLVRASDAVIAISGEFGTLSEIAYALRLGVPVVGLDTWSLVKDGEPRDAIAVASSPADAVRLALESIAR